jgi:WS/DGAT/MGAT family acyltransferase
MEQLSGADASFIWMEQPNTPMHIGGIAIYDPSTAPGGKVRFKDILESFRARLHLAKSFRRKLVRLPGDIDNPYWIDDADFDLEYHVRHIALPKPGDWRQLCILAARLHARPLDMSKPLWEVYVIEGLDNVQGLPPGCFATFSKTHHAAIDGASGADTMAVIHSLTPDEPPPPPPENEWKGEPTPPIGELLWRTQLNTLAHPWRLARALAEAAPGWARLGDLIEKKEVTLQNTGPAPRTRFQNSVSAHRVVDGISVPLGDFKAIRASTPGSTVNDVMLTIVGGGLRRYLQSKGELPDEPLTAMAPISVRTERERGIQGNQVAAMVVSLGTDIADPLARLGVVHASAVNSKALTHAVGARTLAEYSNLMPSALAGLGARLSAELRLGDQNTPAVNTVVTNVPGPKVPLFFGGARLVKHIGTGPLYDGIALMHPVFSYAEEICLAFTADRELMPDPAFYAECLREAFDTLKAAAGPIDPVTSALPAEPPAVAHQDLSSALPSKPNSQSSAAKKPPNAPPNSSGRTSPPSDGPSSPKSA